MGNGTLFDDYVIRMDNRISGRQKQIINTQAEGFFYIHDCHFCNLGKTKIPRNLLRIAHFKVAIKYNQTTETTYSLTNYTRNMKTAVRFLLNGNTITGCMCLLYEIDQLETIWLWNE